MGDVISLERMTNRILAVLLVPVVQAKPLWPPNAPKGDWPGTRQGGMAVVVLFLCKLLIYSGVSVLLYLLINKIRHACGTTSREATGATFFFEKNSNYEGPRVPTGTGVFGAFCGLFNLDIPFYFFLQLSYITDFSHFLSCSNLDCTAKVCGAEGSSEPKRRWYIRGRY